LQPEPVKTALQLHIKIYHSLVCCGYNPIMVLICFKFPKTNRQRANVYKKKTIKSTLSVVFRFKMAA